MGQFLPSGSWARDQTTATTWWASLLSPHDITLAADVTNLKRIIAVCGGRLIIIIVLYPPSPATTTTASAVTRPTTEPSWRSLSQGKRSFSDLCRLHTFITCQVVAAGELLLRKKKARPSLRSWRPTEAPGAPSAVTRPPTRGLPWCPGPLWHLLLQQRTTADPAMQLSCQPPLSARAATLTPLRAASLSSLASASPPTAEAAPTHGARSAGFVVDLFAAVAAAVAISGGEAPSTTF